MVPGRFQPLVEGKLTSYTEEIDNDKSQMSNVFVATETERKGEDRLVVIVAEKGAVTHTAQGKQRYIELSNGFRYEGNPGSLDFRVTSFETFGQRVKTSDEPLVINKSDAKPTLMLMQSKHLDDIAALQWRLSIPVTVPIVSLIALALSKTNPRQGRYIKLLPAVLIYIVYLIFLITARSGIEEQAIPTSLGLWWVHVVFLLLGFCLFYFEEFSRSLRTRRERLTS